VPNEVVAEVVRRAMNDFGSEGNPEPALCAGCGTSHHPNVVGVNCLPDIEVCAHCGRVCGDYAEVGPL
jgi:hypothetical protein